MLNRILDKLGLVWKPEEMKDYRLTGFNTIPLFTKRGVKRLKASQEEWRGHMNYLENLK